MRGRQFLLSIVLTACGFTPGGGSADDDGNPDPVDAPVGDADPRIPDAIPDAPPGAPDAAIIEIAHLPTTAEQTLISNVDWDLDFTTLINTDGGFDRILPPPPSGVEIHEAMMMDDGREAFVVQARSITLDNGFDINVSGSRPLILVATFDFTIESNSSINGSANSTTRGPGGHGSSQGPGAGGDGESGNNNASCGGAGASYGGAGGTGGDCNGGEPGGPGNTYGDPAILIGGSGGGDAVPCDVDGGAGGGAIQLTAGNQLRIDGTVHVGGGGGEAGRDCDGGPGVNGSSGAGGGSGGMIYLQAMLIVGDGVLGANGGGGSEAGSSSSSGSAVAGGDAGVIGGGAGGGNQFTSGGDGGDGGFGTTNGDPGESRTSSDENGGGGGGGAGIIYYRGTSTATFQLSPPWIADPP
jgi:hypothetical protein